MADDYRVVESGNERIRACIHRLSPTMFRVDVEQLFDATDAGGLYRGNFWSVVIGLTSYADSEDRAVALAQQNIRCAVAPLADPGREAGG